MDIPEINNRIRQLVDYYTKGRVLKFSEVIGIKQQTVNRLFNIDNRTGKYPIVTTDVLIAITEMLVDVDITWVLTGRGHMLRDEQPVQQLAQAPAPTIIYKSDPKDARIIALQEEKIKMLEEKLHDRSVGLRIAPAVDTPSVGGIQPPVKSRRKEVDRAKE